MNDPNRLVLMRVRPANAHQFSHFALKGHDIYFVRPFFMVLLLFLSCVCVYVRVVSATAVVVDGVFR